MDILSKLNSFYYRFDGEKGYIGQTERGEKIPYFKVKKSPFPTVIVQYGIHAREYITTYLALMQIENFVREGNRGTVYFIPAVNIDGIKICLKEKPLYKANANGVDLNVNFDAGWGKGKLNKKIKGDENFIGEKPFSEKETVALRDFTLLIKPDITISYHAKGEEIYYKFNQTGKNLKRDYRLAERLSKETGYSIKETPDSTGGYKDWCIDKLKIPSFTLEVGSDNLSHPIGREYISEIYIKNKNVINAITGCYDGY